MQDICFSPRAVCEQTDTFSHYFKYMVDEPSAEFQIETMSMMLLHHTMLQKSETILVEYGQDVRFA